MVLFTDPDERVHEYAVRCLDKEGDEKLELYMNQLVQVRKLHLQANLSSVRPSSTRTSMTVPLADFS